VLNFRIGTRKRFLAIWPLSVVSVLTLVYLERASAASLGFIRWESSLLLSALSLVCGWLLWRAAGKGYGAKLLGGLFFLNAVHGVDRPLWPASPFFLMRIAFDDLLGVALGIAMIVLVLEGARARNEELNAKLRRLTLLTTASTQTLSAKELLDSVLKQVVESVGASHGLVRLLDGEGSKAKLAVHGGVGFPESYLKPNQAISVEENWAKRVLQKDYNIFRYEDEQDENERRRMSESAVQEIVTFPLRGKDGTLGILALSSSS